jgi:nicotinamide riboside kinase
MSWRLGVSGCAGSGKTSLVDGLAGSLTLTAVPEAMRALLQAGFDFHSLTPEGHRALLRQQAADLTQRLAGDAVVTDRTPLDFVAFWLMNGFAIDAEAETARFLEEAAAAAAVYDAVILLPWPGPGGPADGIRSPNPWHQLHFQTIVEGLLSRFLPADRLITVDEPPSAARLDQVLSALARRGISR